MREETGGLTQSTELLRNALRMALIPGIISYFSSNLALLADGVLVGRTVGMEGLAAVSMSTPVVLMISMIGGLLSCGAETICSRAFGNNEPEKAQRFYGAHLLLLLGNSFLFLLLGLFLMRPISLMLSGGDAALAPLVADYCRIYLLGAVGLLLTFPPFWFLPLEGKNKAMTVMMLIMGIGNILLDLLFLSVMHMGVRGAALASVLSATAAAVYGMAVMHSGRHSFALRLGLLRDRKEWLALFSAGSPEAFTSIFQALRMLTVNNVLLQVGGHVMVARFSVLSAMVSICDALTIGIPQSSGAIMGVYCGERDNPSAMILLKQQIRVGLAGCLVLMLCLGFGHPLVEWAYQVDGMSEPLWLLGLSLFPVMILNILNTYYRVAGRAMLANILIAARLYGFCVLSLIILNRAGLSVWLFQITEALLTLALWAGLTWIMYRRSLKKKPVSRWLLVNRAMEDNGNSINFSSPSDPEAICDASERIGTFCRDNKMDPRQIMRVSLALEEMMTLITQFNEGMKLSFDVRVFATMGVIGIRIRYGGISFNPLADEYREDERFMGIEMVRSLVEETIYQRTFGVNSLVILLG